MVTIEEIILKLGLDHDPVTKNAYKAERAIEQIGATTHKSFLHGTTAAKGMHKALESLKDAAPPLGRAIDFALSPIGASLAALGSGIIFARKLLEDWDQRLNVMRDRNFKSVTDTAKMAEAVRKSAEDSEKARRAFEDAERAKNAVSDTAKIGEAVGGIGGPAALQPRAKRVVLQKSREAIEKKIATAQKELDDLRKAESAPGLAKAISAAGDLAKLAEETLAELAPTEAADQELFLHAGIYEPMYEGERRQAEQRNELRRATRAALARAKFVQGALTGGRAGAQEEIKRREAALSGMLGTMRDMNALEGGLAPNLNVFTPDRRRIGLGPLVHEQFPQAAYQGISQAVQMAMIQLFQNGIPVDIRGVKIP